MVGLGILLAGVGVRLWLTVMPVIGWILLVVGVIVFVTGVLMRAVWGFSRRTADAAPPTEAPDPRGERTSAFTAPHSA